MQVKFFYDPPVEDTTTENTIEEEINNWCSAHSTINIKFVKQSTIPAKSVNDAEDLIISVWYE